ncbi:MAG: LysM peptidoglycan-binding domain-containing protein, partial [Candidatus Xenobia bacterium]
MSLRELEALNPQFKNPNLIFPGQQVHLEPTETAQLSSHATQAAAEQTRQDDLEQATANPVDNLADRFESSALGRTGVGHAMGQVARHVVHFCGGVVEGVSGLFTGITQMAGMVVQAPGAALRYASEADFRHQTNQAVSKVVHHPGALVTGVAHQMAQSFRKDPAEFLGKAAGFLATTAVTRGIGAANLTGLFRCSGLTVGWRPAHASMTVCRYAQTESKPKTRRASGSCGLEA